MSLFIEINFLRCPLERERFFGFILLSYTMWRWEKEIFEFYWAA